jgi:hypothetical protein
VRHVVQRHGRFGDVGRQDDFPRARLRFLEDASLLLRRQRPVQVDHVGVQRRQVALTQRAAHFVDRLDAAEEDEDGVAPALRGGTLCGRQGRLRLRRHRRRVHGDVPVPSAVLLYDADDGFGNDLCVEPRGTGGGPVGGATGIPQPRLASPFVGVGVGVGVVPPLAPLHRHLPLAGGHQRVHLREVVLLHGEGAALDVDDGAAEVVGEQPLLHGRAHHHQPQVRVPRRLLLQQRHEEVRLHLPFMHLVDDDVRHLGQEAVLLQPTQQDARGAVHDARRRAAAAVEAHLRVRPGRRRRAQGME